MLSSRTEMQKVIEVARKQSLAAFMQTTTPVPQIPIIPSAIPELKKDDKSDTESKTEKRDRRRSSRSKSRERKDRSRERDRRDRHKSRRSRSRSRERRDRRRRDRSLSRDRTRSKECDRRDRSRERRRSCDQAPSKDSKPIGVWEAQNLINKTSPPQQPQLQNLTNFNPAAITPLPLLPNFTTNRSNWPTTANLNLNDNLKPNVVNFNNQSTNRFNSNSQNPRNQFNPQQQNQFQHNDSNNRFQGGNRNENYQNNENQTQQIEFRNCCVSLSPYYGGYGEIRRFFQGLFIHNTGIKFVNDENGKRTGIVYVRFAYPEGKEQALERNGKLLKNQVCEVIHLDDEEFETAIDKYRPDNFQDNQDNQDLRNKNPKYNANNRQDRTIPSGNTSSLTVEDLPNFVKEQDILKMFSDYSLMSLFIINKRKNVIAYVKFSNNDEAKKAFEDKSKHMIDTKQVSVKPCRDELFEQVSREQDELMGGLDKSNYVEADSNCVLLSGLPLKTSDRDIADIFSDVGIIPDNIHLINGSMGFNGEAFCEFCSIQDAQIALEKDGMPLGSSIISVKCVPKTEMEAILGIRSQQNNLPPKNSNQQNQRLFFQPRNFNGGPRGPPNFLNMRPPMRRFPLPIPPPHNPNDMLGPPGCTVLMENVPYKAGLDEILDFFNDFEIIPDNILRKFNPNGKPSGETKVIFCNADDAYRAVEQKNRMKIRDRTIFLSIC